MSKRKCFTSFKTEDEDYKLYIQNQLDVGMIDKSLNEPINSSDEDYIMRVIRKRHLSDSTVTIFFFGKHSSECLGWDEQRYIKREKKETCPTCGKLHNIVKIDDSTVIKEFSYNYYLPTTKCAWGEDDRYRVLTDWETFISNPNAWIEKAYDKRSDPISERVRARP